MDDWERRWADKLKAETVNPEMPMPKVAAADGGEMEEVCGKVQS